MARVKKKKKSGISSSVNSVGLYFIREGYRISAAYKEYALRRKSRISTG